MNYTVTLNPSLDYIISVKDFQLGRTNRAESERLLPGGKGINVSIALGNLGIDSAALGFAAGFTGAELEKRLEERNIRHEFIRLEEGFTRINFKLGSPDGTEINGQGPVVGSEELGRLIERLSGLGDGDILVLSGSVPSSMTSDIYCNILEALSGRDIRIILDAAGEPFRKALPGRPFLVKPNLQELGELFDVELSERKQVIQCAKKLKEEGAQNVLVSMAGRGALFLADDGRMFEAPAPKGVLVNSVGAGDAMVAGFVAGWLEKGDYEHAFRMGVAAGSASAFSEDFAGRKEIDEVFRRVRCRLIADLENV